MNKHIETAVVNVVSCAISNSIDYHLTSPEVTLCSEKMLENCAIDFIVKNHQCGEDKARAIYLDCVDKAKKKKHADGKCPFWAVSGLCLGLALGVVEIISLALVGFTWPFALFLVISISLCKTCIACMSALRPTRAAAKIWRKALNENTADKLAQAMMQMHDFLINDATKLNLKLEF